MIFKYTLFCIVLGILFTLKLMSNETSYYIKLVDRITNELIQEMEKDGFFVKSYGGAMMNDVEEIILGFNSNKTPSVDEARVMYVSGIEKLLTQVNQNKEIRPYLHNYPFNVNNLAYRIGFKKIPMDSTGVAPIAFVFYTRNKIYYCMYDPAFKDTNPLQTVYKEPYEEALKIVRDSGALESIVHPKRP